MKLLPKTVLYRYQVIAVLIAGLTYSVTYLFTGSITTAVAFTGAVAFADVDVGELHMSKAKVVLSMVYVVVSICLWFYIASHLQIHITVAWR